MEETEQATPAARRSRSGSRGGSAAASSGSGGPTPKMGTDMALSALRMTTTPGATITMTNDEDSIGDLRGLFTPRS